ncbi:hypothetical protein SMSK597_1199 [Streptococcus mitis SK597]|uniref:Uncharacterized protein n=1 Tax=Streptococcus mitis SK597 TaxID=585204 RepID=E1LTA5_STRMT|nr:hypothetical protein SMSK597_1199 [Streptococcus mitis SK597]
MGKEEMLNPVEDYELTLKMKIVKKCGTKSPILSLSLSRYSL